MPSMNHGQQKNEEERQTPPPPPPPVRFNKPSSYSPPHSSLPLDTLSRPSSWAKPSPPPIPLLSSRDCHAASPHSSPSVDPSASRMTNYRKMADTMPNSSSIIRNASVASWFTFKTPPSSPIPPWLFYPRRRTTTRIVLG